ncbi:14096_t:CDS:2, partial [Gigaspora margarita]
MATTQKSIVEKCKREKTRWFVEIERQMFLNNASRLVKDEFWLDKKVQQTVERKENNNEYLTIRYKHCALNQKEKENNCITEIKVENIKECIRNITKKQRELDLAVCTRLTVKKALYSIEIAKLKIELINGLNLKRETKDMLSRIRKALKEKALGGQERKIRVGYRNYEKKNHKIKEVNNL